jgi:sirohydrochlorin cobaltochelatase
MEPDRFKVTSRTWPRSAQAVETGNDFTSASNTIDDMSKKGLLLVGHGSKLPFNKELVEKTADHIARRYPEFVVKCGFMNLNSPTIPESLDAFRKESIDVLVVVPLFLAKGVHILKDIPEVIGLGEGETRGVFSLNGKSVPLLYADPIGSDPMLADLMVKNAERALSGL